MSESNTSQWLVPDWPAPPNIKTLVTTRHGGVSKPPYDSFNLASHVNDEGSAVTQNRQLLAQALAGRPSFQWINQVHGNKVLVLDQPAQNFNADDQVDADAIYTQEKDVACGVLTADCLSVFFCDVAGNEIAVAHAGWRGLAAGILQNTLKYFLAEPVSVMAYLGPVIGPCHFEVGNEVRQAFLTQDIPELQNQAPVLFHETGTPGKWMADLYAIAKIILAAQGIKQIYGDPLCTYCEFDQFYSYRRDGDTGRFASLIWKE